jgi:hypothetical protein
MRSRGGQILVPGPLFPYLEGIGYPCTITGGRAEFARDHDLSVAAVVSRCAVNFGRHEAGLPPLCWRPLKTLLGEILEWPQDEEEEDATP